MKFALATFPDRYVSPAKPSGGPTAALDAHKQTQFLLGDDLALFQQAMNLQLAVLENNKKARSTAAGALLAFWSRTYSHMSDSCALMCSGSYLSCSPLLRTALDCIAVQRSLIAEGFTEYEEWAERAVSQAKAQQAMAFDLGRYRAASVLVEDADLGSTYRLLTDLSMPHFGSTALQVAPETGLERMAIGFADSAFHLGWAELTVGWLLLLVRTQLETLEDQSVLILGEDQRDAISGLLEGITSTLASSKRCRAQELDERFLFHNFRRTASGQPKRVLL